MSKKPVRLCAGCRNRIDKDNLIRIAISNDKMVIDYKKNMEGRGVYVCRNPKCVERAVKKNALERTLKVTASALGNIKTDLMNEVKDE